jgi:hypothetical protein
MEKWSCIYWIAVCVQGTGMGLCSLPSVLQSLKIIIEILFLNVASKRKHIHELNMGNVYIAS